MVPAERSSRAPTLAAYLQLGPLNWGPLEAEGDLRYRVLAGPAAVQLAHLPQHATLALTYRSDSQPSSA